MKKIFLLLLLLISAKAFAQYPAPTGVTRAGNMLYFYKIVGPDTLLYGIDAFSHVYPIGRGSGGGGNTIYTHNDSLTSDRVVNTKLHSLYIGDGAFTSGLQIIPNTGSSGNEVNISSSDASTYGTEINQSFLNGLQLIYSNLTNSQSLTFNGTNMLFSDGINNIGPQADLTTIDTANMTAHLNAYVTSGWVLAHNGSSDSFLPLTFTTNNNVNQGVHSLIFHAVSGADSTHVVIDTGQFDAQTTNGTTNSEIGTNAVSTFSGTTEISTGNGAAVETGSSGGNTNALFVVSLAGTAAKSIYADVGTGSSPGIVIGDPATNVGLIGSQKFPLSGDPKQYLQAGTIDSLIAAAGGSGTVTSITPGVGFLSHTPITTSGTMNVDTASTIVSKTFAGKFITAASTNTLTNKSGNISQWTNDSGYITTISGVSAGGELAGIYPNPTLLNSAVIGKVLTGYTSGAGTVVSTDNILQAIQKLNGNIVAIGTPVTSVTGTTNRITSSGGTTPAIDISSTFEALLGKVANPLSQFASTTSAQLAGVLSDESGSGLAVFNNSPTLITPALGTPSALVLTNATGLPNAGLNNSTITLNSVSTALGGSFTVTTANTDTTSTGFRTSANSRTLAQTQTALNLKLNVSDTSAMLGNVVHLAKNETITGTKTFTKAITASNYTATNIPYFGTGGLISGSGNLTWDNTNQSLAINGAGSTYNFNVTTSSGKGAISIGSTQSATVPLDIAAQNASFANTILNLHTARAANSAFNSILVQANGVTEFQVRGDGRTTIGNLTASQGVFTDASNNLISKSVSSISASADLIAQSSAGTVTSVTSAASNSTYDIGGYINVTAVTTDVIQAQITYTDENNTSQTISLSSISAIGNNSIGVQTIRVKANTTITLKTNLTTGVGSITFDAGGYIKLDY